MVEEVAAIRTSVTGESLAPIAAGVGRSSGESGPLLRAASTIASVAFLVWYYRLIFNVRPTIVDSDITRYIQEFNSIWLSSYTLREPLYWGAGKLLTAAFNDPWAAVMSLDIIAALLLFLAMQRRSLPLVMTVSLALSPMFVLGLCNIHRQLIAFALWMFIINRREGKPLAISLPLHLLPFLVHNSLGLLSLVYFIVVFVAERRWELFAALGAVAFASVLLFGQTIGSYFREGTDTNTSVTVYVLWATALLLVNLTFFRTTRHLFWFGIIGSGLGAILFALSGGSSGSRFFMLVVSAMAFWMFDSDKFREASPTSFLYRAVLAVALIAPTFGNSFSRDIVRAAYYDIPYGTST